MKNADKVTVLLSAMFLADYHYIEQLNIKNDVVIINQGDRDDFFETQVLTNGVKQRVVFDSNSDRGLSKSRNRAIAAADTGDFSDICIFCDNDCVYEEGALDQLAAYFQENPEVDICVSFIERPERKEPVFTKKRPLGYYGAMKIFSPEIAFRRSSLIKHNLKMNEYFGAGARYGMGEENIFLFEAIGKGLRVDYLPLKIAHLLDTESTWFKGYNEKFFVDRGAGYMAMSRRWWWLLCIQFAVRKRGLYASDMGMLQAILAMRKGALEYADICNR